MPGLGLWVARAAKVKATKRAMHIAKAARFARVAKKNAVKAAVAKKVATAHIAAAFRG